MTNSQFLARVDARTRVAILEQIARHYGIDTAAAQAEVTHPEAEDLLEYLTGPTRAAASVIRQRLTLRATQ